MGCELHFEQFEAQYACSCGWTGRVLDRRLIGDAQINEGFFVLKKEGKKVRHVRVNNLTQRKELREKVITGPMRVRRVGGEITYQRDQADIYTYLCPRCGREFNGQTMIVDIVTKEVKIDRWPWLKKVIVTELRRTDDIRQMLSYSWRNWGFSIFWEIQRLLDPDYPKKSQFEAEITDDMDEKAKIKAYAKAKNAFKKAKTAHRKKKYTLNQLFAELRKVCDHNEAVDRINAIITALKLEDKDTDEKFPILKLAFKLALERSKLVETHAIRKKYNLPDGESLLERMVDFVHVDDAIEASDSELLKGLRAIYPDLHVRLSVGKEIEKPGLWKILDSGFRAFRKNERKAAFFKFENPDVWYRYEDAKGRECFEYIPEYDEARGDLTWMEDGSSWQYWPDEGYVMIDPPGTYNDHLKDPKIYQEQRSEDDEEELLEWYDLVAEEQAQAEEELEDDDDNTNQEEGTDNPSDDDDQMDEDVENNDDDSAAA